MNPTNMAKSKADNYKGSGLSKGAYLKKQSAPKVVAKAPSKSSSSSGKSSSNSGILANQGIALSLPTPTLPSNYKVTPQEQKKASSSSSKSSNSSNKSSTPSNALDLNAALTTGGLSVAGQPSAGGSSIPGLSGDTGSLKLSDFIGADEQSFWDLFNASTESNNGLQYGGNSTEDANARIDMNIRQKEQDSKKINDMQQYVNDLEKQADTGAYMGTPQGQFEDINKQRMAQGKAPMDYSQWLMVNGDLGNNTGIDAGPGQFASSMINQSQMNDTQYANKMGTTVDVAAQQRAKQQKSYEERYKFLSGQIKSKVPVAEQQRSTALSGVDAEMQNLTAKADIGKQNIEAQYADTENNLKEEKTRLDQDLARIFEGRNVMDSSYFVKEQQKSNDKFLSTVEKLGGDKARSLAAYDADITYYQKQSIDKRSEIEQAYNQTIQKINEDLTKTQFEKEDALMALDKEFQSKIDTIDNNIMEFSMKQQEFRQGVQKWYLEHQSDFTNTAEAQKEAARQKDSPMIKNYMAMGFTLDQAQKLAGEQVSSGFKSSKTTQSEMDTEIRQDLLSADGQSMSDEEKIQYIISKGGNPSDFGYYPSY